MVIGELQGCEEPRFDGVTWVDCWLLLHQIAHPPQVGEGGHHLTVPLDLVCDALELKKALGPSKAHGGGLLPKHGSQA